jgi:hypothetical protein
MKTLFNSSKLLATGLALTVTLSTIAPAFAFYDTQGHWASQAITILSQGNIFGGYPDGTFKPEGRITRAEFSAILVKSLNLNTNMPPATASFADVPSGFWAFPAIEAVKTTGLVSGYPGGAFMPNKTITRAEALTILANAARLSQPDDATANNILSAYSDNGMTPAWARRPVAAALQAGFLNTVPGSGNLLPNMAATRAEIAAMTQNFRTVAQNGQPNTGIVDANNGALQGSVSTVAEGTVFTGTLKTGITSETSRAGDQVVLVLDRPLTAGNGAVVVPSGSTVTGVVESVQSAGRTGKNGLLGITFSNLTLPSGASVPISARISTETGILDGGTTKGRILRSAGKVAIGAGLGAALGTAMGPLSSGKVGKGAIYGTAVGGILGAGAALAGKGRNVVLQSGDQLEVKLQQPISVNAQ